MTLNDEDMDTFVFAVGTKKAMGRLQKELQDLVNTFFPPVGVIPQLVAMCIIQE